MSQLPKTGWSKDEIRSRLDELRATTRTGAPGGASGWCSTPATTCEEVARLASVEFLSENGLNPLAFPSIGRMQQDVVDIAADLFHGGDDAAGFMTSGGTESLLLAVKAARNRGREERGITASNMVIADSAHAAFHKASEYFGVEVRKIPVRADWRADVDAMAAAVDDATVLVVGSAPQYPQGVIDPIPELAALARRSRHQLPRRRLHGRVRAAVRRAPGPDGAAVGLPGRRGDVDLRRRAQARLRAEGRVGAGPPQPGAAPSPDLRLRRLARRLLRVVGHRRQQARRARSRPRGQCSTSSARRATSA